MTSAWTWFIANADMGSGGGGTTSGITHGGNVSIAHLAVYPYILPLYRIIAHYWAAMTGFGLLPAPGSVAIAQVGTALYGLSVGASPTPNPGVSYSPDGSIYTGGYATTPDAGIFVAVLTPLAAQVVAVAGGYTSGPSIWGQVSLFGAYGSFNGVASASPVAGFVTWTGVATKFNVYSSTQINTGAEAAVTRADGVAFTSGYGASASVAGIGVIGGGSGGSPPAAASAIGDTVAGRIERVMGYGNVTYPGRCIDQAPLLVQAALDVGGQAASQNVQAIAISDGGMLYVDNVGAITYWQRSHLASQYANPVWLIGPTTAAGEIPYDRDIHWVLDPQRAWNAITISPYSPTGASLPLITPSNGTGVVASQKAYGAQPYPINSYLQSQAEMASQANWLFTNFGQPQRRAEKVKIDAASYPGRMEPGHGHQRR